LDKSRRRLYDADEALEILVIRGLDFFVGSYPGRHSQAIAMGQISVQGFGEDLPYVRAENKNHGLPLAIRVENTARIN
jgi:hypothetical protein